MSDLKEIIMELSNKIDSLQKEIEEMKKDTHKMSNHIDFIENLWNIVKRQFVRIFRIEKSSLMLNDN